MEYQELEPKTRFLDLYVIAILLYFTQNIHKLDNSLVTVYLHQFCEV